MYSHLRIAPTPTAACIPQPRADVDGPGPVPLPTTRVMLVSPDGPTRLGWSSSLRDRVAGRLHIDEASSAAAAVAMISSTGAPRLVLLDLRGGDPGADRLLDVLAGSPSVRVVVIGRTDRAEQVRRVLMSGAGGYLFGDSRPTAPRTTTDLHGSETTGTVAAAGTDQVEVRACDGGICRLSRREVEVLQHVANGEPNSAIAHAMGLSAFTVKSHLSRIRRRLGTGERGQMVYLAMRAGVLS